MTTYSVVHDGEQWRILTHHRPTWIERSGPLPSEAQARRVVRGLTESQGLEGETDEPPAADHANKRRGIYIDVTWPTRPGRG